MDSSVVVVESTSTTRNGEQRQSPKNITPVVNNELSSRDGDVVPKNVASEDTVELLQRYYKKEEFYHDNVRDQKRFVLLLSKNKEISNEAVKVIREIVTVKKGKNANMYYTNCCYPFIVKLDSVIAFQGHRENYSDPSSKLASLDCRIRCKRGEKHYGILSLLNVLCVIGSRAQEGSLRNKERIVREVINSDDKQRYFPGARARIMPCPPNHETCLDTWRKNDDQNKSIREHLLVSKRNFGGAGIQDDSPRKPVFPLCLFARKLVRPLRALPTPIPPGLFATPPQFDAESDVYIEAQRLGLRAASYAVDQLINIGEGNAKLIQCVVKPHYKALWRKSRKNFKAIEIVHGTYEVFGFYLESGEKMTLQLEIMDELVTPIDSRFSELENHEGAVNFSPEAYNSYKVEYSDDEDGDCTIIEENDGESVGLSQKSSDDGSVEVVKRERIENLTTTSNDEADTYIPNAKRLR